MTPAHRQPERDATPPSAFDVVVVGGGPAGCAAALTLLKYSALRVAVVERSDFSQARLGETAPPGLAPLLEYLGVWEPFVADSHVSSYGTAAAWGSLEVQSRDFLITGRGYGWHLDRRRFDRMLAEQVVEHGGTFLTESRIVGSHREEAGSWQLGIAGRGGIWRQTTTRLVIDASGKSAAFARRVGADRRLYDRLVGVAGFYTSEGDEVGQHFTLVESFADGWWYSAVLPQGGMVATLLSDADLVRSRHMNRPKVWLGLLAETRHTRDRLSGGKLQLPLQVRPAHSQLLQPTAGPGWTATGDAASSFDPLSGMGIGHALTSGMNLARAVHGLLTSDGTLLDQYIQSVARNFHQYRALHRQHYLLEQRWPDRPFWHRRHQSPPDN